MPGLDDEELKQLTEEHWEALRENSRNRHKVWKEYVEALLPQEMKRVETRSSPESCCTLVLLVGHSIEPLLQSVWAHKPKELLLILNRKYGEESGEDFAIAVCDLLSRLPPDQQVSEDRVRYKVVQSTPADVFQVLVKKVRSRDRVVVDITGAKKSMVAGAFLYAAYADVPVSYVDFDDAAYNTDYMKPYGYASRIRSFMNPYTTFALRDWERVRRLYKRYKFHDARMVLIGEGDDGGPGTILDVMAEYLPESKPCIQELAGVLRCYESWDAGEYNQAADFARQVEGFEPPSAVSALGGRWFRVEKAKFLGGLSDFYDDTSEFRAYVYDELARVRRLIKFNRDYRSAFLRAGSLNEIVMLARLVKLVDDNPRKRELLRILQEKTPSARSVFRELVKPPGSVFHIGKDIWIKKGIPEIQVRINKEMSRWWQTTRLFSGEEGWDAFIDRRNDLAHKYFSVPLEWAEDALNFVRANIEDFWGLRPKGMNTEAIEWSELCKVAGLKKHLPPNLCVDGNDGKEEA